jgi:hypothetical protein
LPAASTARFSGPRKAVAVASTPSPA